MVQGSDNDVLAVSHTEGVSTVMLRQPALDVRTKEALREQLSDLADDEAVRAVVLTGTGRNFCLGQDLGEHAAALEADPTDAFNTIDEHYNPIITSLMTMPKPVIAAINGTCVGAGLGIALACDLRIAADTARFSTAFTGIGLTCDSGLSATLVRAVGAARASELVLLGETFSAAQAAEWGIAGRVAAADDLASTAAELAGKLANGPTLAYAEAKAALASAWAQPFAEVLRLERDAQAHLGRTDDHVGAVRSFLAKEAPRFRGR